MRYLASRVAIVGSLLYLVLWIGSSLIGFVALAAGNFGIAAALARPAWTIDLPLFGFLGVMIFGLALHFMTVLAGRELRYPKVATAQVVLALASVGLSLGIPRLLSIGRGLWLAAAALFVGLVLVSLRTGPVLPRLGDRFEDLRPVDRCAAAMTRASAVYLLAASVGFVLVSPGGRGAFVPALASYGGPSPICSSSGSSPLRWPASRCISFRGSSR